MTIKTVSMDIDTFLSRFVVTSSDTDSVDALEGSYDNTSTEISPLKNYEIQSSSLFHSYDKELSKGISRDQSESESETKNFAHLENNSKNDKNYFNNKSNSSNTLTNALDDLLSYDSSDSSSISLDYPLESMDSIQKLRQNDSPFHSNKRNVSYNNESHCSVIFQMHGSVWPYVLPFCIINVLWTYFIFYLKSEYEIDITLPSSGHNFMNVLVSFLVVSRVQITYNRFVEARKHLGDCLAACRELMHNICIFTMDSDGVPAAVWRRNVAEKILRLLRLTIAAIEFSSKGKDPWEIALPRNTNCPKTLKVMQFRMFLSRKSHHYRTRNDEALRAPLLYSGILRSDLIEPRSNRNILKNSMSCIEELKLLQHVTVFTSAYHGLYKLITTPFPFPLVQMTRTILFFWLFTLPLSLMRIETGNPYEDMAMIFFVTYGFLGLEYVSIEMDDPFGDDPNDFNNLGMAQRVYEDIYVTIFDIDGEQSAEILRETMTVPKPSTTAKNPNTGKSRLMLK